MRRLFIALSLLCLLSPAGADWDDRSGLEDAVSEARDRYDGRILSAETVYDDSGREVYRLRILTPDGRVRRIQIDADDDHGRGHRPHRREHRGEHRRGRGHERRH